jgi:hypothetical protein
MHLICLRTSIQILILWLHYSNSLIQWGSTWSRLLEVSILLELGSVGVATCLLIELYGMGDDALDAVGSNVFLFFYHTDCFVHA